MPSPSRKTLTAIATVSALAAGGAAFANAATKTAPSSSSSSSSSASEHTAEKGEHGRGARGGPRQEALTGTTAAKVKAAALDKVPGGTVLRSEKGGPGNAAYHAHVRKANGSEVVVLVDSDFEATAVQEHDRP